MKDLSQIISDFQNELPEQVKQSTYIFKILIIDSDTNSSTVLSDFLKSLGYGVLSASSQQEAESLLRKNRHVSLIISASSVLSDDGKEVSGIDVLNFLKKIKPSLIPILAISFAESEEAVTALRQNIVGFLIKPYDKQEISNKLREYIYMNHKHDYLAFLIRRFLKNIDL